MRIAILGPAHPYRGGIASYNERLAQAFMEQGHEVEVFTFTLQYPNFLFPGKTQYTDGQAPSGVKISRVLNTVNPFNWLKVGRDLSRKAPDVLIVRYWLPFMGPALGTVLRKVKKNGKTRVICLADNVIPHEKRPGDEWFTRYFLKAVHGAVVMAPAVERDLKRLAPQLPSVVSPHPLFDHYGDRMNRDEACQQLGIDPKKKVMLFFGLVRKYKGLDLLLEAFADSRFRTEGYQLLVAGECYGQAEEYYRLIDELGLKEEVIWHERFIPDEQVKAYFSAADLVVQPYRSATQSGVTQIAYHFEVPMVVTRVGGLETMCPDGLVGHVVEPKPSAIADAIYRYFSQEEKEKMKAGMVEEKKKFAWDLMCDALLNLAKSL